MLKRFVSMLLRIDAASISEFVLLNTEILPEALGDKFCRLDVHLVVNGQKIDIEIQVKDERDYPERSLYYFARDYSSSLQSGMPYKALPRVFIISIVAFDLFEGDEIFSEFEVLEVKRHSRLTDKLNMQYYELPKLPKELKMDNPLELWLQLINAKTDEDLAAINGLGVPELNKAVTAYTAIAASPRYLELERLRSEALSNEAAALARVREEYDGVIADKDAEIAALRAQLSGHK
ncbi:hypothetical protein FACS1894184_09360 [Clostridia bacterium]|nr:hypothetical protein FACS1894184_09360 [Clostridia bacterium]